MIHRTPLVQKCWRGRCYDFLASACREDTQSLNTRGWSNEEVLMNQEVRNNCYARVMPCNPACLFGTEQGQ